MRRALTALALVLAGTVELRAREAPSPDALAAIDAVFEGFSGTGSPGCALGVVDAGQLALARGYGMASLELGVPNRPHTAFYAGSVSKQFVAAAVLMAARRGHLSLDDRLDRWFPELPGYASGITVRHLIHHTSGLRDYLGLLALAGQPFENVVRADQVLALIARQRALNFEPGSEYLYSNSGYFLLAQLVERATGQSLRRWSARVLFQPLGMRDSRFHDDRREVVPERAAAYAPAGGAASGDWIIDWSPAFEQVGSGGLITTVGDLARWERSFEDGRLGEGFWDAMLERGALANGEALDYAFGLVLDEHLGTRRIQHSGGMFGYRAQLSRYPEQRLSVLVLCNTANADPGSASEKVAALWMGKAEAEAPEPAARRDPVDLSAGVLDRYAGEYRFSGFLLEVVREGGALVARVGGSPAQSLEAISVTRFQLPDGAVAEFGVAGEGASAGRLTIRRAARESVGLRAPTRLDDPARLERITGRYWSDELQAHYVFELAGDAAAPGLSVRVGPQLPVPVTPRVDGSVDLPGGVAELRWEGSAPAAGFRLDAGRVRGLEFEREP